MQAMTIRTPALADDGNMQAAASSAQRYRRCAALNAVSDMFRGF